MKKFVQIFIFTLLVGLMFACNPQKQNNGLIFDAKLFKGHPDTTEVKKLLDARPDTAFYRLLFGRPRYIQMYDALDSTEFRFKHNKLIEIIVHKPTVAYSAESVTRFGLPFKSATSRDTSAYIMWKNVYPQYPVVNFYLVGNKPNGNEKAFKIYFKLKD
ncbi:hypothetical protein [Prolixibacter sp. NT017]|uniref:hypothetical protein n=1 Tax=Prolixibacter sp. NT017 TaxID=2652390 RepID=UPI00128262CF|nr:hypothetical protein [Prolixibacter sp. NT017]GET27243.1 hypothetical protein NT017_35720 [Prolixibacter sp. NT017]